MLWKSKKTRTREYILLYSRILGFEPRLPASEAEVLPLHYILNSYALYFYQFVRLFQVVSRKFYYITLITRQVRHTNLHKATLKCVTHFVLCRSNTWVTRYYLYFVTTDAFLWRVCIFCYYGAVSLQCKCITVQLCHKESVPYFICVLCSILFIHDLLHEQTN